jgi:LAO/AO transport system kinase
MLRPVPPSTDARELIAAVTGGDRRALARLLSSLEDQHDGSAALLAAAFDAAVPAHRVGVTGAPGAGKSTLTDGLVAELRRAGRSVAVLAVDPTSPFSGGAILGDRVRMQRHVLDEGVYVRSMASRGHLGGLSIAAPKALLALEAAGFDEILVETVGVGQDEVEIAAQADTVVVVLTPGWGDGVQAAKAGILEIGDVFVVNKADRPGVAETVSDLRAMLALGHGSSWVPPIVTTTATEERGIADVWEGVSAHREHLGVEGLDARRRRRRLAELEIAVVDAFRRRTAGLFDDHGDLVASVEAGSVDPWSAARQMVE